MSPWLLIMVLASMPWKPQYWPTIAQTPVVWSSARCHHARACYYDGVIYLQSEWEDAYFDKELHHAVLHEMQHHVQCQGYIWRTGAGWTDFVDLLAEMLESGTLSEQQVEYLKTLLGDDLAHAHEVHAELPWVLRGHLPEQFAPWYPWFDVGQPELSWVAASQE